MFLPMSWTSPFTVASSTLPALRSSPGVFSASRWGMRYATAFFMTRALFTTCGRNMRPDPKRSPTTFIPSMSGPSMTSSERRARSRASSTSPSMKSSMPCTSACVRRSSTGAARQASSSSLLDSFPWCASARCVSVSVAPGRRAKSTSSMASSSPVSISS